MLKECCCDNPTDFSVQAVLNCPAKTQVVKVTFFTLITSAVTMYVFQPTITIAIGVATIGGLVTYYSSDYIFSYKTEDDHQKPIALNYASAIFTKWTSGNIWSDRNIDIKIADQKGGTINVTGEAYNYIELREGKDIVKASLCKLSKKTDTLIDVINYFDTEEDKLHLHCTKYKIELEDISIYHAKALTYIEVEANNDISILVLAGDIDIKPADIILN